VGRVGKVLGISAGEDGSYDAAKVKAAAENHFVQILAGFIKSQIHEEEVSKINFSQLLPESDIKAL